MIKQSYQELIIIMFCMMISVASFAQTEDDVLRLKDPISEKWGYASKVQNRKSPLKGIKKLAVSTLGSSILSDTDAETIDWVVPPLYDNVASEFSEHLAGVEIGGQVGFIDINNRFIIEPQFEPMDDLAGFSLGMAAVKIGSKFGYINKKGEVVISPIFDKANNFKENMLATVKQNGKYGAIDLNGHLVVPCKYPLEKAMTTVPISNKLYRQARDSVEKEFKNLSYTIWSQLKACDEEINSKIADSTWIQPLQTTELGEGNFKGIKDHYKRMIIPCQFATITYDDTNHLYIVKNATGKYGLYSYKGDCLFRPLFDSIENFEYEQCVVSVEGVEGTIDNSGWIDPSFMDEICNEGLRYDREGNASKAYSVYERILTIDPNHVMALNNQAIIDIDNKDYNKGMKKLKLAHKLAPDNELISENLHKAKKNRNERRWNRINNGLEIAAAVITLGAATYSVASGQSVSSSGLSSNNMYSSSAGNSSSGISDSHSSSSSSNIAKKCKFCAGSGKCSGNHRCRGSGKCNYCNGEKIASTAGHYHECGSCHGTGKCSFCSGSGKCKHCGGTGQG